MAVQGHITCLPSVKRRSGLNNNVAIISYGSEDVASKSTEMTLSTIPLSFYASSPGNPCEYPHKPYTLESRVMATSSSLTVWVYLHSNFRGGLRKTHVCQSSRWAPLAAFRYCCYSTCLNICMFIF